MKAQGLGVAGRFRSGADDKTNRTLAALQERVAAQQSRLDSQRTQIAALQASSEDQQARIQALTEQLRGQDAQIQTELQGSADKEQQLYACLERLVGLVVQNQQDLLRQLRESLASLSAQDEDTKRMAAVSDETDSQPATIDEDIAADLAAVESAAPAPPAEAEPAAIAAASSLDSVYTPLAIPEESEAPGVPIPRQRPDEQLKVMRVFINADMRFVDYIGEDLPKAQVNRLEAQGKLERHRFHPYKLRPTALGRKWYAQATAPPDETSEAEAPAPDEDASQAPVAEAQGIPAMQLVVGEPDGDSGRSLKLRVQREPDATALDDTQPLAVTDIPSLEGVLGVPGSDSARLLTLLMGRDWRASEAELQAAFPRSVFVNVIIDDINERAQDTIDDNLIIEEAGMWTVEEDHRAAVAACLNGVSAKA